MKLILIFFLIVLFACQNHDNTKVDIESENEVAENHPSLEDPAYLLRFESVDSPYLKLMEDWLDRGINEIELFFNKGFKDQFRVIIYSDRESFDKRFNTKTDCSLHGIGREFQIDLLSPRVWLTGSCEPLAIDTALIYLTVAHELVHVFHDQHSKDNPDSSMLWFNEGIAVYVSGQLNYYMRDEIINYALNEGINIGLENLSECKFHYSLSGSLVKFIDDKFGREIIIKMLDIKSSSELFKILNITEEELLSDWKEWLRDQLPRCTGYSSYANALTQGIYPQTQFLIQQINSKKVFSRFPLPHENLPRF